MLGLLNKLFGKSEPKPVAAPAPAATPAAPPQKSPTPTTAAQPAAAPVPATKYSGETLAISLTSIVEKLPAALKPAVARAPDKSAVAKVPLSLILAQLPQGSVRISLADLRAFSPAGSIGDVAGQEATLLELPLKDIIPKLDPSKLPRRKDQKKVEVPNEVGALFSSTGQVLKPVAAPAAPVEVKKPEPPPAPVVAKAPEPAPVAPPPPPPEPAAISMPVMNPGQPLSAPIPFPGVERAPEPATPPPAPKPAPPAPAPVAAPLPKPTPPPAPAPFVPSGPVVSIPLAAVFASWPEPIKGALASLDFAQAKLEIPCSNLEPLVKRGRITLTWGTVRGLIRPALAADAAQDLSAQELDLPLPVVVPLFLQKQKPSAPVRKTLVPTDLPELFKPSGAPAAKPAVETAPAAAPVAAPAPLAPKPVVPTPAPAPAPAVKKALGIGDILGNPKQTDWPLNDVVMGGCNLPGVAGMVIATDDGMLVAGQLGEGLGSDQFAAVIPAAFTRLEPLSEALQKPKPAQLVFQLDNTPLAMFRAGTLFLAVLGRPGGTLPMDSLKVVAAYLEKQSS